MFFLFSFLEKHSHIFPTARTAKTVRKERPYNLKIIFEIKSGLVSNLKTENICLLEDVFFPFVPPAIYIIQTTL
jgi:hypothetical protein